MSASSGPRPVVVGVDDSDAARRAVSFAADAARRRGAPLHVVHAMSWPFLVLALPPPGPRTERRVRDAAEEVVRAAVAGVSVDAGVTTTVADGEPDHVLRTASRTAQLVVVGSRGVGGVAGLLVGSTASGLVGSAACPVVVLPDPLAAVVRPRRSVVVGVEGRTGDAAVLAFAFAEAAARGTELVAVHAWQDVVLDTPRPDGDPPVDWTGVAHEEERLLSEALSGWRDEAPDVPVREAVVRDRPARALAAAGLTAELVVVGHRHRWSLASTTHGLLHGARCPVAVVPVPDAADG